MKKKFWKVEEKGGRGGRENAETAVPVARSRLSVRVKTCGARGDLPLQLAILHRSLECGRKVLFFRLLFRVQTRRRRNGEAKQTENV